MDWLIGLDDKERTRLEVSGGNKYNPEFAVSCTEHSNWKVRQRRRRISLKEREFNFYCRLILILLFYCFIIPSEMRG